MLGELEDPAIIGALPLEYRGSVMQCVGEDMDLGVAPRDQLAIEPYPAVAVVVRALLLLGHVRRLGQASGVSKLAAAPRRCLDRLADQIVERFVEHGKPGFGG